jgi:hypothetical protein
MPAATHARLAADCEATSFGLPAGGAGGVTEVGGAFNASGMLCHLRFVTQRRIHMFGTAEDEGKAWVICVPADKRLLALRGTLSQEEGGVDGLGLVFAPRCVFVCVFVCLDSRTVACTAASSFFKGILALISSHKQPLFSCVVFSHFCSLCAQTFSPMERHA